MTPSPGLLDPPALHLRRILLTYAITSGAFGFTFVSGREPIWLAFWAHQLEAALFLVGAWRLPRLPRRARPRVLAGLLVTATGLVVLAAFIGRKAPFEFLLVLPLVVAVTLPDDLLPVIAAGGSCLGGATLLILLQPGDHQPGNYLGSVATVAFAATFGAHRLVATRRQLEELHRLRQEQADQQRLATVGEAAAAVAHEVRNPLAAISNAVSLIRSGTGESNLLLDMIREEIAKLERFVTDLLVLARPLTARSRTVDLALLLQRCARIAADPTATERFVLQGEGAGLNSALADPDLLEIALVNLMRNALQASPEGAPIRVEFQSTSGSCVISVEDEGPGVPPELRARMFEPFFTTKQTGTGLGLAITRRIVAAHRGQIHLRAARMGQGSRFEIELPQA
ncbi:MAG: ATP-binding protein [Myxococcota bacterium]|nr:ATP-binding protein [Myxococcota bacterium]